MENINQLINKLKQISPIPDDEDLTEEILIEYESIIHQFINKNNPDIIEPLIKSFGYGDAYGLYWTVIHIIEEYDYNLYKPFLINAIESDIKGNQMWAIYMAGRAKDSEFLPILSKYEEHEIEYIKLNAKQAIEKISQ